MASDSKTPTAVGYKLLRESCGQKHLTDTSAILLTGADVRGWLQGQVTQDLRNLRPESSLGACLCKATGQIEAILHLYRFGEDVIITTNHPGVLLRRVAENVILEDVSARQLDGNYLTIQGPQATKVLSSHIEFQPGDAAYVNGVWLMRKDRTGLGGWDILLEANGQAPAGIETIDDSSWDLARLEAGFPEFGVDIDPKTLPPELGSAFDSTHVSYKKGCYSGQEVLHRIHARGHTNRTWVGLFCDGSVSVGDVVSFRDEPVGTLLRVGKSPEFGIIAAAMLKNKAAVEGLHVTVGKIGAEIIQMPFLHID